MSIFLVLHPRVDVLNLISMTVHSLYTFKKIIGFSALVLSSAFAMFCMFFGSGNLIFPLAIGQKTGSAYVYGILGLTITGVILPFFGLIVTFLFQGSYQNFFKNFDRRFGIVMPLVILSLMGPFAVMPRCITVAHGSFLLVSPYTSIWQFSLFSCFIIYILSFDKGKIVPLLGSALTPILLFSLGMIIYSGISAAPKAPLNPETQKAFLTGMHDGYQMMDLLAAFFFSATVVSYLKAKLSHKKISATSRVQLIVASLTLGALFLAVIYAFLIYLGAAYSQELAIVPVESRLAYIAQKTLGHIAGPMVATAVGLACITTAIVLTSVVSDYYQKVLFRSKISKGATNVLILTITFFISTLKFNGIAQYLSPILTFLYPGIIMMTLLSLGQKLFNWPYPRWIIVAVFVLTFLRMVLN